MKINELISGIMVTKSVPLFVEDAEYLTKLTITSSFMALKDSYSAAQIDSLKKSSVKVILDAIYSEPKGELYRVLNLLYAPSLRVPSDITESIRTLIRRMEGRL